MESNQGKFKGWVDVNDLNKMHNEICKQNNYESFTDAIGFENSVFDWSCARYRHYTKKGREDYLNNVKDMHGRGIMI